MMSQLSINNRQLSPARVTALKPGQELSAVAAVKGNGADDVIFKVGNDTYLASGRGLALRGVKAGDPIKLDGQVGQVVTVDRQLNTFMEGMLAWPGLVVGGGGAAFGIAAFVQGVLSGATFAGLGIMLAGAALVAGLVINVAPAIYGAMRKPDYDAGTR
jgi:hypothetical protein